MCIVKTSRYGDRISTKEKRGWDRVGRGCNKRSPCHCRVYVVLSRGGAHFAPFAVRAHGRCCVQCLLIVSDIERFVEDPSAGRFADPVRGRRREQQRADQVSERRVRRIRAVVDQRRWRRRRRQAGHAATARPGHREDIVRLGERHIHDEAERQAEQEKVAITAADVGGGCGRGGTALPASNAFTGRTRHTHKVNIVYRDLSALHVTRTVRRSQNTRPPLGTL